MARYEDPDWPSAATGQGQGLRFAEALSRAGRKGKVVAFGWLLMFLVVGVFALVIVLSAVTR